MKKVLFIAPNFPPAGGIGVQRSIALVKGLRLEGYEPIVLTVSKTDIQRVGSRIYEAPMLKFLEMGIEIHRVHAGQPYDVTDYLIKKRLYRFLWTFGYPWFWERFSFWPKNALAKASELIEQEKIELIYSSSAPYTAMELAMRLKRKHQVKWVNDIRDPWTEHFGWIWPSKLHWIWSRWKEKRMLKHSDRIVVVTPEMKEYYGNRKYLNPDNIHVITNGF
jgi:glycosyltransferase involved in cell wall biosynthesis